MKFHVTDRSNRTKQLVATMLLEAADQESSEIWLITPWLKNVEFNAEELGPYKSLLGGAPQHRDVSRTARKTEPPTPDSRGYQTTS